MEYKEVKKKDGQILIFCNFEDLLMEFYGVGSMEEAVKKSSELAVDGDIVSMSPASPLSSPSPETILVKASTSACALSAAPFASAASSIPC